MTPHRPEQPSKNGHSAADLRARIDAVSHLTPSEERVAEFYLQSLPGAAFLNLAQVSQASGVSTASVTRFARRLAFTDFRAMNAWFMEGARHELEKPYDRRTRTLHPADHPLARAVHRAEEDLQRSLSSVDTRGFDAAVDLVTDADRPLYAASVASGQPLMQHFALLLGYVRGDVHVLDGTDRWPHQLAGLDGRCVVLAAAYDRDPLPLVGLLQMTRDVGAASIMITNQHRSPLLRMADVGLTITTAQGAMFGSRVATLCVLEALLDAVSGRWGETSGRAVVIERAFDTLAIHPNRR